MNAGSDITERGYELRGLNSSLCKRYTDSWEIKIKLSPKLDRS